MRVRLLISVLLLWAIAASVAALHWKDQARELRWDREDLVTGRYNYTAGLIQGGIRGDLKQILDGKGRPEDVYEISRGLAILRALVFQRATDQWNDDWLALSDAIEVADSHLKARLRQKPVAEVMTDLQTLDQDRYKRVGLMLDAILDVSMDKEVAGQEDPALHRAGAIAREFLQLYPKS